MYVDIINKVTKCHFLWNGDQCKVLLKKTNHEGQGIGAVENFDCGTCLSEQTLPVPNYQYRCSEALRCTV